MLLICTKPSQINFGQLMRVYSQSNRQSGAMRYPDLSDERQLYEAEQDYYLFLREFYTVPDAVYLIWTSDGIYKSALRLEPYRDGLLIEGLETAPEYRKMGYAKKLLSEAVSYISATQHSILYSHIAKNNFVSQNVHMACGFREILDYAVYIDGSVDRNSSTFKKECNP